MLFEIVADFDEFVVYFRIVFFQLTDFLRRANAGDDVFALRVHQIFAEKFVFAGRGAAAEAHARAGIVAHIAEHHRHNGDGRSLQSFDIIELAVLDRARIHPRTENRVDRVPHLLFRILREFRSRRLLIQRFVFCDDVLKLRRIEFVVEFFTRAGFRFRKNFFEFFMRNAHRDVAEHLNKAAVRIPSKARIVRLFCKTEYRFVVEAEVEDRVHHTGHGARSTRADGNEQRIVRSAEFFTERAFELCKICRDVGIQFFRILSVIIVVHLAHIG